MTSVSGGQLVVKVLEAEGVQQAFCVPGESYLEVLDDLYEHDQIKLITTRHESGAAFMAEGYAKITGDVGICMATRGPGAMNLSIGLHTAMQDSTPLIALVGQVERPFIGKEAFQEVDFEKYFSHLCKWSVEIKQIERIPELLHRAFYIARSGRPGPVVVSLPHDMLQDIGDFQAFSPISYRPPMADAAVISTIIQQISQAKRPFVIAGGGVIAAKAQKELMAFAETLHLPVASAFRRFNVLSNEHDHYAGWLGFGANPALLDAIVESDLIIVIGSRLSQVTTQDYTLIHAQTKIIQIDISEEAIGKAYQPDIAVTADAKQFLKQALSFIKKENNPIKAAAVKAINHAYHKHATIPLLHGNTPYVEMNGVVKDLKASIPNDSVITSDAGNFYGWLARYFMFTDTKQYIGPTSGAMGYGLPSAIGVKAARPDQTVISISGDGGFMMTVQELETAVREQLKIIAIVVNNHMYGTIRAHQEKRFPGRVIGTNVGNPSFAEMAKLYGCEGVTVKENEAFLPAFKAALTSAQPFVIEVLTNPEVLSVAQAVE